MDADPEFLDSFHQRLGFLVRDHPGRVPTRAAAEHMEDHILAHKDEIALHLVVELIRNFHAAHIVWARFGPFPTDLTRLYDARDEFKDSVGDSYLF